MIYTPLVNKALKLCYEVHKNQYDKSGLPYVFHPVHLAEQFDKEELIIVALLHDILEDSKLTRNNLLNLGFTDEIVEAIDILTRKDDSIYVVYSFY